MAKRHQQQRRAKQPDDSVPLTPELIPPATGEALLIEHAPEGQPSSFAFVWPSVRHTGFYEVLRFVSLDDGSMIQEWLWKPIAWKGVHHVLEGFRMHFGARVKRRPWEAEQLDGLRVASS